MQVFTYCLHSNYAHNQFLYFIQNLKRIKIILETIFPFIYHKKRTKKKMIK